MGAASSSKGVERTFTTLCKANLLAHQFYLAYLRLCAPAEPPEAVQLSEREREILKWAASGKTKRDIGQLLGVSAHTVDYHARKVLRKLDAPNLATALLSAIKLNLIQI